MTRISLTLAAILSLLLSTTAAGIDKAEVKEKWHTPFDLYLSAQEAYEMKTAQPDDVLFLDVRNIPEIHYIGMADQIDANVPFYFDSKEWKLKKDGVHGTFRKIRNPDFEAAVENALKAKGLTKESAIIIMCTSGSRAPRAARALHEAGFKKVYTQVEGFEGIKAKEGEHKGKRLVAGWKFEGLPWSYDLPAAKMYFNFDPKELAKKAAAETASESSQ